jgi:uncharacterized protein YbaP (TraB family)
VEKNGVTNWLLGTAHMPIEPTWVPPELAELIKNARVILSEHGDSRTVAAFQAQERQWIQNRLALGPYRHLEAELDAPDLLVLKEVMKASGSDIDNLNYLPPAFVGKLALGRQFVNYEEKLIVDAWQALSPERRRLLDRKLKLKTEIYRLIPGYVPEKPRWRPLDQALIDIAEENKKPIRALDSLLIIEKAFVSMNESDALRAVLTFTKRIQMIKKALSANLLNFQLFRLLYSQPNLFLNYLRWNPEGRQIVETDLHISDLPDYPVMPALLKRHTRWMSLIHREFAKGGTLVVVGDGHVTGREGEPRVKSLIELLRDRGYKVTFESHSICEDQLKSLSTRRL